MSLKKGTKSHTTSSTKPSSAKTSSTRPGSSSAAPSSSYRTTKSSTSTSSPPKTVKVTKSSSWSSTSASHKKPQQTTSAESSAIQAITDLAAAIFGKSVKTQQPDHLAKTTEPQAPEEQSLQNLKSLIKEFKEQSTGEKVVKEKDTPAKEKYPATDEGVYEAYDTSAVLSDAPTSIQTQQQTLVQNGQSQDSAQQTRRFSFLRILFHLLAIMVAGGTVSAAPIFVDNPNITILNTEGRVTVVYLSLLLLFPLRVHFFATFFGLIVAALGFLTGYWPLGLVFGAVTTFVLTSIGRRQFSLGSLFALLLLVMIVITEPAVFALMPPWYNVAVALVLVVGIMISLLSPRPSSQPDHDVQAQPSPKTESPAPATTLQNDDNNIPLYEQMIDDIARLNAGLTPKMANSIVQIEEKARAIVTVIKNSPHDTAQASSFLNRYLPVIRATVQSYSQMQNATTPFTGDLYTIQAQAEQSLSEVSQVFNEMHQKLISDHFEGLADQLKTLDQLTRSEKFDIPPP